MTRILEGVKVGDKVGFGRRLRAGRGQGSQSQRSAARQWRERVPDSVRWLPGVG